MTDPEIYDLLGRIQTVIVEIGLYDPRYTPSPADALAALREIDRMIGKVQMDRLLKIRKEMA